MELKYNSPDTHEWYARVSNADMLDLEVSKKIVCVCVCGGGGGGGGGVGW